MALAGKIDHLGSPDEVLAALAPIAAIAGLTVFGVWRWSMQPNDMDSYILGRTLFSGVKYVDRFLDDLRVLRQRHGPSVTVRRVWNRGGSFTLTEAMRDAKASGDERYIVVLFARYGIRDAFYCPCGLWLVLYTSRKVLKLTALMRSVLQFAAGLAAARLEILTARNFKRLDRGTTLTAREHAVLYQLAIGKRPNDIAKALGIMPDTVWTFLRRAEKKLNTKTPTHAVAEAMMRGLLLTHGR
jgi:DNA-binding CsgD family transcriptional regulator